MKAALLLAVWMAFGQAAPGGWQIARATTAMPAGMHRTVENVTVDYSRVDADTEQLRVVVNDCGDPAWNQVANPAPEGTQDLKDAIADAFRDARTSCKISDGVEERIMSGFDAAFAQFQALSN